MHYRRTFYSKKSLLLGGIALALVMLGCDSSDESKLKGGNTEDRSAFFNSWDFPIIDDTESRDLNDVLLTVSNHLYKQPGSESSPCIKALQERGTINAGNGYVNYFVNASDDSCNQSDGSTAAVGLKWHSSFTCDNIDYSDFNSKSMEDLEKAMSECQEEASYLNNLEYNTAVSGNGYSYTIHWKWAQMSESGKPCKKTYIDDYVVTKDCSDFSYVSNVSKVPGSESPEQVQVSVITTIEEQEKDGSSSGFPESGEYKFSIGDWEGKVIIKNGKGTYDVTSPSGIEKNGNLSYPSGYNQN